MPNDDLGTQVTIPRAPKRVVSLVPSLTEAIATSAREALVGATQWCTHPADLDVPRIRGTKNPDIDAIASLRPDLVVANQEENRRVDVERLRHAGIAVWVTRVDSVPEALASLDRLFTEALALERPAWLDEADSVWHSPAPQTGRRVVAPIWRDPWMVVGAGTYGDDVLTRLGFHNSGADLGPRYPKTSLTAIRDLGPDVVVLPDEPYAFSEADGPAELAPLTCRLVPGRALSWYGPAMVDARGILTRLLDGSRPEGTHE
jgi:ABC-type Fe3+-hydroxamate transport system substrate-binding protein